MKKKPELLAPAGDMEKLKMAVLYGADAVYLAGTSFGMRSFAGNFTPEELPQAVRFAHDRGVRVHVTVNTMPRNDEVSKLPEHLERLNDAGVDALILADLGAFTLAGKYAPRCERHISTQQSVANYECAAAWYDLGAKRVVLARELTLQEICELRQKVPAGLELEVFCHGAMCVSYSGRCLLSNYIAGRDSNKGECVQPCRWSYEVRERGSSGEYFTLVSERNGSFILNSRDMCMIDHLDEIADAGIVSLKIEGRMKSILYVATVVNAYRMALDGCDMDAVRNELNQVSHRPYTTGFMLGEYGKDTFGAEMMAPDSGGYVQDFQISAVVLDYDAEKGIAHIEQRNRFFVGDELLILSPKDVGRSFTVTSIVNDEGESMDSAPHPCESLYIGCSEVVKAGDILRKRS